MGDVPRLQPNVVLHVVADFPEERRGVEPQGVHPDEEHGNKLPDEPILACGAGEVLPCTRRVLERKCVLEVRLVGEVEAGRIAIIAQRAVGGARAQEPRRPISDK